MLNNYDRLWCGCRLGWGPTWLSPSSETAQKAHSYRLNHLYNLYWSRCSCALYNLRNTPSATPERPICRGTSNSVSGGARAVPGHQQKLIFSFL